MTRHAFLQKQFRCRNHRFAMKSFLHRVRIKIIVERDQTHALMMRHEGADQGVPSASREPPASVEPDHITLTDVEVMFEALRPVGAVGAV